MWKSFEEYITGYVFIGYRDACFTEVKEKSSHYGLNTLGYTCATRVNTNRYDSAS
jgi:hypothetical protein